MLFPFDRQAVSEQLRELDAWRAHRDAGTPLSRSWTGRLRADLEAEAVAASTAMEGVAVTVEDVRRILAGDRPDRVTGQDRELVLGYRDAMQFVMRRAEDENFEWARELIVGVHDRVLAGRWDDGAGRLRTGPTWIPRRETGNLVFTPAPADHIAGLVDQLCAGTARKRQHPAVTAAWLHIGFAAVHPFRDGNGRTARVLASLAMYRGGFRSRAFTSLEEWWGRHPSDYYAAFECLGDEFNTKADVTPFIKAHVSAQLSQVRALDLRERTTRGLWTVFENLLADIGLAPRLANALWDGFFGMDVTAGYYRGLTDVSPPTASNDLKAISVSGMLRPVGEGRGRKYQANLSLFQAVGRQLRIDDLPDDEPSARDAIILNLSKRLVERTSPPNFQRPLSA